MEKKSKTGLKRRKETSIGESIRKILPVLIVALQLLLMGYWSTQKSNYYIDEMFSMGYAHTFIHPREDAVYINFSKDWGNEKWIENETLKDQLETTREDSVFTMPFAKAVRKLFLGRNYMGMLNILMSVFSPGKMSRYPGIILNLIIFALSQLLLYRICRGLGGSFSASLMTVTMYGFSTMAIGLSLYIRFYAWVIFLLLALIRLHQVMWNEDRLWKCEILTVISMLLAYFALKNSELVFIMAGGLIGAYALGLLLTRHLKKALLYVATIVPISLIYAVTKTPFVDMILHPANYIGLDGPQGWMTRDLLSMSSEKLLYFARLYKRWLDEQMMGSKYVTFAFLIIVLILLEIHLLGRNPGEEKESGSVEGNNKKKDESHKKRFVWIILCTELIYLLFCFLTCLPATRYVSFLFPFFPLLLWAAIDRLSEALKRRSLVMAGCALLTVIGILSGLLHPERIEYVYLEDRPLLDALTDCKITDSVIIYTDEEDATHVVYDCVNLMPDKARVYPVQEECHHIDTDKSPNDLLIWVKNGESIRPCVEDLEANGYQIERLGRTHASDIYTAHR